MEDALNSTCAWMSGHQELSRGVERDIFATYIVLAIALCDFPNHESPGSRSRPPQSQGCFLSALVWIEKVIAYSKSELEALRAILLLAQFVALNPSWGSLWHLTGIALRLCIDLGLHWETDEKALNMDPAILHDRRRLWWSTYHFDRVLCCTLGRPFGISDESVRVPLPSPWTRSRGSDYRPSNTDIHAQRAHNHLLNMSILESEIKNVQQNQICTPKLARPKANYSAWILDIQPRLQEWYDTIPPLQRADPSSIFAMQAYWDSIYHNALLLLYRPNSANAHQSLETMSVTFDASCKLIANIKILQREGRCESLWKTVHHLFMAGMGVMYELWQSKEIRDREPMGRSISTLQYCASTLAAMSETFPPASACRDVFDTLSSATIDFLVTNDASAASQNRVDFDRQLGNLLQGLQTSYGGSYSAAPNNADSFDLSNMASVDCFAFGEMLNSAAQWPEILGMEGIDFSIV
jgi:hypothetical protein